MGSLGWRYLERPVQLGAGDDRHAEVAGRDLEASGELGDIRAQDSRRRVANCPVWELGGARSGERHEGSETGWVDVGGGPADRGGPRGAGRPTAGRELQDRPVDPSN